MIKLTTPEGGTLIPEGDGLISHRIDKAGRTTTVLVSLAEAKRRWPDLADDLDAAVLTGPNPSIPN